MYLLKGSAKEYFNTSSDCRFLQLIIDQSAELAYLDEAVLGANNVNVLFIEQADFYKSKYDTKERNEEVIPPYLKIVKSI